VFSVVVVAVQHTELQRTSVLRLQSIQVRLRRRSSSIPRLAVWLRVSRMIQVVVHR
jgi:hypothetical protein